MPKTAWRGLAEQTARTHLVVAVLPAVEQDVLRRGVTRAGLSVLKRLCSKSADGAYAVTVTRQGERPALHCAFAQEADAKRIGEALEAVPAPDYGSWASVRTVLFGDEAERRARAAADAGKRRRRRPAIGGVNPSVR
jgi:hypothetical protein